MTLYSSEDITLRCKGNSIPEAETVYGSLGDFYDAHVTVEHNNVYFDTKGTRRAARQQGQSLELEMYIDIQRVCAIFIMSKTWQYHTNFV